MRAKEHLQQGLVLLFLLGMELDSVDIVFLRGKLEVDESHLFWCVSVFRSPFFGGGGMTLQDELWVSETARG